MDRYSSLTGFISVFFVFSFIHQDSGQELTKPDSIFHKTINKIVTSYNSDNKEKALEQAQKLVNILEQLKEISNLNQSSISIKKEAFFKTPGIRKISYNPRTGVYFENAWISTGYFDKGSKQYTRTSSRYPYVITKTTKYSSKKK